MWPRLQLLKELLSDDGVIFVSIDDHEQHHLRMLMDEIFGEKNFIDTLVLIQNLGAVEGRHLREVNEHIHIFAKDVSQVSLGKFIKDSPEEGWASDEIGTYRLGSNLIRIGMSGTPEDRPNLHFPIFVGKDLSIATERRSPLDEVVYPTDGQGNPAVWRWGKEKVDREPHNLLVKPHRRMKYQFTIKIRPSDEEGNFREKPTSLWNKSQYSAASATNMMKTVFGGKRIFDFPKSVALVQDIVRFANVGEGSPPPTHTCFRGIIGREVRQAGQTHKSDERVRRRHRIRFVCGEWDDGACGVGVKQRRRRQSQVYLSGMRRLCGHYHGGAGAAGNPGRSQCEGRQVAGRVGWLFCLLYFGEGNRYGKHVGGQEPAVVFGAGGLAVAHFQRAVGWEKGLETAQ